MPPTKNTNIFSLPQEKLLIFIITIFGLTILTAVTFSLIHPTQTNPPAGGPTPPPTAYTCPTTAWVDCMPKIQNKPITTPAEENKQCSQEFLNWATKNCPGFKGAAY